MANPLSHQVHSRESAGSCFARICRLTKTCAGITGGSAICLPDIGASQTKKTAMTATNAAPVCNVGVIDAEHATQSQSRNRGACGDGADSSDLAPTRLSSADVIKNTMTPQPIPTNGAR